MAEIVPKDRDINMDALGITSETERKKVYDEIIKDPHFAFVDAEIRRMRAEEEKENNG